MPVAEYAAEPVAGLDRECVHGEGPFCDPRTGELLWVDGLQALLHRMDPALGPESLRTVAVGESFLGFARPHGNGGYVVSADNALWHLPSVDDRPVRLVDLDEGPAVRVNDGAVDPQGRLWAGTMAWDETPGAGTLWVWPGRGAPEPALRGLTISNGLDWSPSGAVAYFVDSAAQSLDVLRLATGADGGLPRVVGRDALVAIDPGTGTPDGIVVDDAGCVWVALWAGSAVHRYSPAGELLAQVSLSASQVSAVCFGGADRDTLYVTTSQQRFTDAQRAAEPDAGRLFSVRIPGVTGPPARVFVPG